MSTILAKLQEWDFCRHGRSKDWFVSPSGQYYAVVEMGCFEVRIDCANVHTLRKWLSEGVPTANFIEAFNDGGNVRDAGGWGTC